MASWRETPCETGSETISSLVRILLESPSDLQAPDFRLAAPAAALRHALGTTKNGRTSWIGSTAHFFLLFVRGGSAICSSGWTPYCSGPLDADSLDEVAPHRQDARRQAPALIDLLRSRKSGCSNRSQGPHRKPRPLFQRGGTPTRRRAGAARNHPALVCILLAVDGVSRTAGWNQSVDLCAWHTALEMGKSVIGMESLEEQVASLGVRSPRTGDRLLQRLPLMEGLRPAQHPFVPRRGS